jgi:hypothetical protein
LSQFPLSALPSCYSQEGITPLISPVDFRRLLGYLSDPIRKLFGSLDAVRWFFWLKDYKAEVLIQPGLQNWGTEAC